MSQDWYVTGSDSGNSWDTQPPAQGNNNSPEGKAPWFWLVIGVGALVVLLVISFFLVPSGNSVALGYFTYWLLSLTSFLVPFGFFVTGDLKAKTTSTYYLTNSKTVSTMRALYLVFGLGVSTVFVYGLADELSRILNAVN